MPVRPDLTLVLAVSPAVAAGRMAGRIAARRQVLDRYEAMGTAFHGRVAEGFAAIAAADPDRCVVVSADGEVDEVHRAVLAVIARRRPIAA